MTLQEKSTLARRLNLPSSLTLAVLPPLQLHSHLVVPSLFAFPLVLRFLQHFLDDLLLLNQKRSDDAISYAVGASGTAIGALHRLLGSAYRGILSWAKGGDLDHAETLDTHVSQCAVAL